MYLTKLQEERFKRDSAIYDDFLEMRERHEGLVSKWKLAGVLAPKYSVCQMAVWRIITRMEGYRKGEKSRVEERETPVNK